MGEEHELLSASIWQIKRYVDRQNKVEEHVMWIDEKVLRMGRVTGKRGVTEFSKKKSKKRSELQRQYRGKRTSNGG